MPTPFENAALYGAGSCGGHQQVYGAIVVGGEEVEPFVFINFKADPVVCTVDGAPVALSSVIAEDTDFGAYDPSDIVAGVGLLNSQPVFIGDALALILGGSTIVCTFALPDLGTAQGAVGFEMIDSTNYALDIYADSSNKDASRLLDGTNEVSEPRLAAGTTKIAVTLVDGKIARSTNGNPVQSIDPSVAWSPPPGVMLMVAGQGAIIESVGLYPAQADIDLPALCDIGYPINTVAPEITGTAQVGETLSVSSGTWDDADTFAYQWYGTNFVDSNAIPGATSNTYLIDAAYEGTTLMCSIAATNATGTSTVGAIDDDVVIAA